MDGDKPQMGMPQPRSRAILRKVVRDRTRAPNAQVLFAFTEKRRHLQNILAAFSGHSVRGLGAMVLAAAVRGHARYVCHVACRIDFLTMCS